jgi:UDP-N-acetylmuramate dehydrogenase
MTPEPARRSRRPPRRKLPSPMDEARRSALVQLDVGDVVFDEPLARWTSFGCGGPAEALVRARDAVGLARLMNWCRSEKVKVTALGRGRGVAVRGGGLDGVTVVSAAVDEIVELEDGAPCPAGKAAFLAGAGVSLAQLAAAAADRGASAPQSFADSRGTVGGAIRRRFDRLAESLDAVLLVTDRGKCVEKGIAELGEVDGAFPLKRRWAISGARFCFPRTGDLFAGLPMDDGGDLPEGAVGKIRLFEDPAETTASEVLDSVATRGIRLRDVVIGEADPNWAINLGEGTVNDLQVLTRYVVKRAIKGAGIELGQAYRVNGKKRRG